jgi:hypothetical protein
MKPTLTTLVLIAALAAGCSPSDIAPIAHAAVPSAQAAEATAPLYPPLQADAKDGTVFEYY